jgi:predicted CXXCH cytochrome family protein
MNRREDHDMMKKQAILQLILTMLSFAIFFCLVLFPFSTSAAVPTHLDNAKIKKGCGACHKGHGKKGTPMLVQSKDELCFTCHSISGKAGDIFSQLSKPSNHKIIETSRYHVTGEDLSGKGSSVIRHASCLDCHNVHESEKGAPIKGLLRNGGKRASATQVRREYELCYNCHADNVNLSDEKSNVSLAFSSSNPSFHPVETFGRNASVPSLKSAYRTSSLISCSDCHGSDNPTGPKGPHGSNYSPILKYRYTRTPGPESDYSYALCYSCHERKSIVNDESFKSHKMHVVYNRISCAQCHSAHGSRFNRALILFDTTAVWPNSLGEITFLPMIAGKPRCYLSCHVNGRIIEHKLDKTLNYSINNRSITQW